MRTFLEARTGFIVTEHHGRGKFPPGRFLASTIDVSAGKFTDTRFTSSTKPVGSAFAAAGMSAICRPIRPVDDGEASQREARPNLCVWPVARSAQRFWPEARRPQLAARRPLPAAHSPCPGTLDAIRMFMQTVG